MVWEGVLFDVMTRQFSKVKRCELEDRTYLSSRRPRKEAFGQCGHRSVVETSTLGAGTNSPSGNLEAWLIIAVRSCGDTTCGLVVAVLACCKVHGE